MLMSRRFGGGCGPTQGSWRCGPCERESMLESFEGFDAIGLGQETEAAAVTGAEMAAGRSALFSIATGVGTGLVVWVVTRMLDRHVMGRKR